MLVARVLFWPNGFNTSEWPQLEKRWHKELKALEKHECPYSPTYSLYFLRVSSFVSYMEDLLSSRYNRKREEFFILQDKSSHSCHQNFSTSCLGKNSKSGYSHTFSADDNGHQVKQKSQGKLPQQGHSSENLTIPHAIQNKKEDFGFRCSLTFFAAIAVATATRRCNKCFNPATK